MFRLPANVARQIELRFRPPRGSPATAVVAFVISRNGTIHGFRFLERTGSFTVDLELQGAIESAADAFGALPRSFGGESLPVTYQVGSASAPPIDGTDYPPTPIEMFIPPLPVPAGLRGKDVEAEFDVDEKGRTTLIRFTRTGDGGYDRRLEETFKTFRFRSGTKADGTPIRMQAKIKVALY